MNSIVRAWIRGILAIICLFTIFYGHQIVGRAGVGIMLVGLIGLLVLLWDYNRPYSKS